jgi:hypothetical protein
MKAACSPDNPQNPNLNTPLHENLRTYTSNIQWNLDLSFFKGVEKTNDEYGETINPENHFF